MISKRPCDTESWSNDAENKINAFLLGVFPHRKKPYKTAKKAVWTVNPENQICKKQIRILCSVNKNLVCVV